MLGLSGEALRSIASILGADRDAHVGLESAAALHLGLVAGAPLIVVAGRAEVLASPVIAPVRLAGRVGVVAHEGLRVSDLESTIVELCTRPTAALGVTRAAELLRRESAIEGRTFDAARLARLGKRASAAAARRRLAWLLGRSGHEKLARSVLPAERSGAVKLDPLGPADGPRDGRHRLVLNVADGFSDPEGSIARALADHLRAELGIVAGELALLVRLGVPLLAGRSRDRSAAIVWCAERGFVVVGAHGWSPRAPFDAACVMLADDLSARDLRRTALALAREAGGDASATVDAALVATALARDARLSASNAIVADAARLARSVDVVRATRVLELLGAHLPSLARRHFLERVGRWDEAAVLTADALRDAEPAAKAELLLDAARLAWRRGQSRAAAARLDELERRLARRRDTRLSTEAHLLRATLAIEVGAHDEARALLSGAMRVAESAGNDLDRARALHRIGTLEARRGHPTEASAAYRAALESLGPTSTDSTGSAVLSLRAILESNLASMSLWLGRWSEAESLGRAALEKKLAVGTYAEVVVTKVLLARIDRARERPLPPGGRFAPLAEEAPQTGDHRLRVEVFLDLAEELARGGALASAEHALDRARTSLALLDGSEPVLVALVAHVDGLVRGLAFDAARGLDSIDEAARALDRLHGAYWAARARRDAASLAESAGQVADALERLAAVTRTCTENRFVLGEDSTHAPLFAVAVLEGDAAVRAAGERALRAIGPSVVRARLLELGRRGLADALRDRSLGNVPDPVAILRGPEGARAIDADERMRVLRGVPDMLVLDERGPTLVRPDGHAFDLGRRRTLAPLLRALAAREGDPLTVAELARVVWERRDSSAEAAVKMSVSRLRGLLGPWGDDLVAVQLRGTLAYRFARPLPLLRLESTAD